MLIGFVAYAEIKPPKPEEGGAPPPGLPIDGGLPLLLASGVVYGIYSLKKKYNYFSNSLATYLPITSNSKLTTVPTLKV